MKLCCAQITQEWNNVNQAFSRAEDFLTHAGEDAEMVVFPEQYAAGWRPVPSPGETDKVRDQWISLARTYDVCIVGSYMRRDVPEHLPYNTMIACAPDGTVLAEYDKVHLFAPGGEDKGYSAGTKPVMFSYNGVTFGCSICFDLRFPELYREYMRAGAEVMLVQAAWPAARIADFELLMRARALENRCYTVACNCLGYDTGTGTDFAGRSMICDFEGWVIADAGVFEGGCFAEADCEAVKEWQKKWGLPDQI